MESAILIGDVVDSLSALPDGCVQCVVTSPPYWALRDYGMSGQIGLEPTPQEYVQKLVHVFSAVRRVLSDDGVFWLNLGDSYITQTNKSDGFKVKDIAGIPWRVALALQEDGWYLRQDIIWNKPNPMPESVYDRFTKSHEYVFMLTKSAKYYFDPKAVEEDAKTKPGATWAERKAAGATAGNVIVGDGIRNGTQRVVHGKGVTSNLTRQDGKRNRRSVWEIPTKPFKGAHFAVMPESLVEPCILSSSREGDFVLDPFMGSGTVAIVSLKNGRKYLGCELNPDYVEIAKERISAIQGK